MTNYTLENALSIIQKHWNLHLTNALILRNSNKIHIKVQDANNIHYIVKGEVANMHEVEKVCQFANSLNEILPTSYYVQTKSGSITATDGDYIFTLEHELLGEEVHRLNDTNIMSIASHLGKLHAHSLKQNLRLNRATSWAMFGGNATDAIGDYDENECSFWEFEKAFHDHLLFPEIREHYVKHRSNLQALWPTLPIAATQGDFCYYNMLFQEDLICALFDYNLAGDEVLLNECIALAIYHAWHIDYSGELNSFERFALFVHHYEKVRPFTALEKQAFDSLFAIIRAFRFDRIEKGIEEKETHEPFLQETFALLQTKEIYSKV